MSRRGAAEISLLGFTQQGVQHPGPNPGKHFSTGFKSTAYSHFSR